LSKVGFCQVGIPALLFPFFLFFFYLLLRVQRSVTIVGYKRGDKTRATPSADTITRRMNKFIVSRILRGGSFPRPRLSLKFTIFDVRGTIIGYRTSGRIESRMIPLVSHFIEWHLADNRDEVRLE